MADSFESDREAQLRDKAYRIASMTPSEEGYDPARSARARELLGSLAKHAPTEVRPPQGATPKAPQDDVQLQPNQTQAELAMKESFDPLFAIGGAARSLDTHLPRMPPKVEEYVVRPLAEAGAGATLGGSQAASDLAGTDTPEARGAWEAKHPGIAAASRTAGALSPYGLTMRAAGATSKALESALAPLIRSSPRVAALLGYGGAALPTGGKLIGTAARGALEGGTLAAEQGAIEGLPQGPAGIVQGATEGAEAGAKGGAAFGAVQAGARGVAGGLRTPEIALAEKYGMEPGMTRPLANENQGPIAQRRNPSPTGVDTAGPASREAAGLRSGEALTKDLNARRAINDKQIMAERQGNKVEGLHNAEIPEAAALDIITALRRKARISEADRGRLDQIANRIREFSAPAEMPDIPANTRPDPSGPPTIRNGEGRIVVQGGNPSGPPTVRPGKGQDLGTAPTVATPVPSTISDATPAPPKRSAPNVIRAEDLQDIAGGLAYKLGQPDAPGGPKNIPPMKAGRRLKNLLPGEMQEQDTRYHQAQVRNENVEKRLNIGPKFRAKHGGPAPLAATEKVGDIFARASEDTKAGAKAARRIEPLLESGPPEVMTYKGKPSALVNELQSPSYRQLADAPGLQTSQESLQLNPSAVFSGGKPVRNLVGTPARRFIYPEAKRIANAEAGPYGLVGGDIVGAVKAANEKRKKKSQDDRIAAEARRRAMSEHEEETKRRRNEQFQQDQE